MTEFGLQFYVIGDPIEHSLSPLMQNFFLKKFKIAGHYSAQRVDAAALESTLRSWVDQRVVGLNVTTPHKTEVVKFLAELTPEAEIIGSVNTIKIAAGRLIGHNTDAIGFAASLKILNYALRDKNAILFGAGGAARAVAVALGRERCQRIVIANRNFEMAKKLAAEFSRHFSESQLVAIPLARDEVGEGIKTSHLLVNATTVGMGNLSDQSIVSDIGSLHPKLMVYDLIYRPYKTKLIQQAESCGARWINGLDMLILQGIESLKFWIGRDLQLDDLSYAEIKNVLRACL